MRAAAKTDLVLAFASQMLNLKSDLSGNIEVKARSKVFEDERADLLSIKKAFLRKAPPGLDATQVMTGRLSFRFKHVRRLFFR